MRSPNHYSALLEAQADEQLARRRRRHLAPLKGLRGVSAADVLTVLMKAWGEDVSLPRDSAALSRLFTTAHEDGLVAIGLTAAALPDSPDEALALAYEWLDFVDDLETADALGWYVLGPGLLATGQDLVSSVADVCSHRRPERRRAGVMACMAALPVAIEGPVAGALRDRMAQRHVAFVDAPLSNLVGESLGSAATDVSPHVRKALARVLREWAVHDPDAVGAWTAKHKNIAKTVRQQADRAVTKARRSRRQMGEDEGGDT